MHQWRRRKKTLGVFSKCAKRCKSVNISQNNNTNKKFFQILTNYTIWDGLIQKTISRYCPFNVVAFATVFCCSLCCGLLLYTYQTSTYPQLIFKIKQRGFHSKSFRLRSLGMFLVLFIDVGCLKVPKFEIFDLLNFCYLYVTKTL